MRSRRPPPRRRNAPKYNASGAEPTRHSNDPLRVPARVRAQRQRDHRHGPQTRRRHERPATTPLARREAPSRRASNIHQLREASGPQRPYTMDPTPTSEANPRFRAGRGAEAGTKLDPRPHRRRDHPGEPPHPVPNAA